MRDGLPLCVTGLMALMAALLAGCQAAGGSQGSATLDLEGKKPLDLTAQHYKPIEVSVEAKARQYKLPLKKGDLCNPDDVRLTDSAWQKLLQNGFVVGPYGREEEIAGLYESRREHRKPVIVTTDTVLHLYHVQFDETLKAVEESDFIPRLTGLSQELLKLSQADSGRMQGELKEAARRNVAYLSVGLSLLSGKTQATNDVRKDVQAELKLIEAHEGFAPSPIFVYKEDYSQYVPRGHYTRSEELKRYFKAMMWYGRLSMLLKGKTDKTSGLIGEKDARLQTLQACLIASYLYGPNAKLAEDWGRIYGVTAFYVGLADDLTPYEYGEALAKVCGTSFDWAKLATDEQIHALRSELATYRAPQIYGGTGDIVLDPPFSPEQLDKALEDTKGLRLMGQRFIPDSFMFQQLVFPAVEGFTGTGAPFTLVQSAMGPIRGFPRGLDVMAVLGSQRAYGNLKAGGDTAYKGYDDQLAKLREQFGKFTPQEWNRNLYWSWLYALQALIEPCGEGYPTFMQGEAWQDRRLWAALASWAELRHDTILYAKQSYTMKAEAAAPGPEPPPPPPSYVEPAPEFYARLLALSRMTREGLGALNALDETAAGRLQSLEQIIERLMNISVQELKNEKLSEKDYQFIDDVGEELEATVLNVEDTGLKTTIVADVHTDGNTEQCLEEGVGYVQELVAAYPVPDGRIAVGAGPVLSTYEFKQPMAGRLTDEAWREALQQKAPEPGKWTGSFVVAE